MNTFYKFIAIAIACVSLISCNDDEDVKKDTEGPVISVMNRANIDNQTFQDSVEFHLHIEASDPSLVHHFDAELILSNTMVGDTLLKKWHQHPDTESSTIMDHIKLKPTHHSDYTIAIYVNDHEDNETRDTISFHIHPHM